MYGPLQDIVLHSVPVVSGECKEVLFERQNELYLEINIRKASDLVVTALQPLDRVLLLKTEIAF